MILLYSYTIIHVLRIRVPCVGVVNATLMRLPSYRTVFRDVCRRRHVVVYALFAVHYMFVLHVM